MVFDMTEFLKMKIGITVLVILVPLLLIPAQPLRAQPQEDFKVIKISPEDETAVVKNRNGDLDLIKVGDSLGEYGGVKGIGSGRIVLEKKGERGSETTIIRVEDGEQRIERIRKAPTKAPVLYTPQSAKDVK